MTPDPTHTAAPLEAGIHRVPEQTYHADLLRPEVTLSSTLARLVIDRSPRHAWTAHPRLNPEWEATEKRTFDIGRAAHRAVLGVGGGYEVYPEDLLGANGAVSTKAAKEWDAEKRDAGITPLKAEDAARIERMSDRVHDRLDQMRVWLDPDRSELVALAEIDGAWCRAMIDNAPEDPAEPLYDFKTCEDASADACMRAIMRYGYDVQAAHYTATWKAATGEDRPFRFVFEEKAEPHEVCVIELGPDSLMMGGKKIARAREIWRQCIRSGHWPGYPTGVQRMELPEWHAEKWLEREAAEADYRAQYGHDVLDRARLWQAPEGVAAE